MVKRIMFVSLVLIMLLLFTTCTKEPSVQEIVDGVIVSFDNIRTYQFDMDVTIDWTFEDDEGGVSETTSERGYSGAIDVENRQLRVDMRNAKPGQSESEDGWLAYIIDGMMYALTPEVTEEEPKWMKGEAPEGWWEDFQKSGLVEFQIELLEAAQVEVIGRENVGGIDCYVLKVTSDLEKLWQLSHYLTFHEPRDVTEEYLQEIFRSFSIKHWVAKDTYFLMKAEINIASESLPEEQGGPLTEDISLFLRAYDYNQTSTIELPPEAEVAIEMSWE